ncbi:hypothetical protein X874_7530 [Mannheimia varigena USDA-ARS-USMARC-1312]|nr:hypothetical protein X874_7530 [Mannheimia varigena USDA-ARS-USMARC-1312]
MQIRPLADEKSKRLLYNIRSFISLLTLILRNLKNGDSTGVIECV